MLRTAYTLITQEAVIMACATSVHIAAPPAQAAEAQAAADACLSWLKEVETCLTRFDATSELSDLNRAAGTWFPASEILFTMTQVALAAAQATAGLFDPTLLPQITALGYDRDYDLFARQEVPAAELPPVTGGWRGIQLDPDQHHIFLPFGVSLDFGGIAKGWAVDTALARFCAPFPGAILNLGGDIALRGGPQPDEPWPVGIFDPIRSVEGQPAANIAVITLNGGGIATSGATRRWWRQQGTLRHHLLDPRTGLPTLLWINPGNDGQDGERVAMATALAPSGVHAEIAAKLALLAPSGVEPDLRLLRSGSSLPMTQPVPPGPLPNDDGTGTDETALLLVMGDGQLQVSANFETYLAKHGEGRLWRIHS